MNLKVFEFEVFLQFYKQKFEQNPPEILETFFESEKEFPKIINKKAVPKISEFRKISEFPKISTPFLASRKCAYYLGAVS